MQITFSTLFALLAAIAFAKDVEFVFVPATSGTEIVKVESVTIDGTPVRFEVVPKSEVRALIDVYRRSIDGFEFESTGYYVPILQVLDPAVAILPVLKQNVPERLFKPLLERRVHKAIDVDFRLVRLMYVASGRHDDLDTPPWAALVSVLSGQPSGLPSKTASRSIVYEILGQRPEPLSLIIPAFPLKTPGFDWSRIKRETKAYNGFTFSTATSDWNSTIGHARSLLRSSVVIQVELPETSSKPELIAIIRGTDLKGKRFEVRRRLR